MPGLNQGYRAPLLTNVMIKYRNAEFIAEQLFPTLPVKKDLNFVFVFDKENLRPPKNSARGMYDRAERVDNNLKQVAMPALIERALEQPVSWKFRRQADDPFDPMIDATNNVTEKIAIEKEVALAAYLSNPTNCPFNETLSGSAQWSDYTTGVSNPLTTAQAAATSILLNGFQKANVAAMGRNVMDWLINHPVVVDRMKYTMQTFGDDVEGAFARALRVKKVLVGEAVYNNSQSGQADSMAFIWGNHIWWMYVADIPALYTTTAGYHLIVPEERYVDTWTEVPIKSDIVRCNDYYTRYTFSPECIYAVYNAVSGPVS
jgi:hypothetical protein